ncbi:MULTISPECIES: hypothetical protein [Halorussus]|uniref:hypothetical protein n=1 Tax=Halorussus TaxID=1070314 RepID=UPI00209F5568|nr:hypothetical protein [Halorussus vallis]USZ74799.1 hypothetical protein NGM07_15315 [Halorussus vallis]
MPSRRRVLAVGCLALTGGAGCVRMRSAVAAENANDGTDETTDETTTETTGATATTSATGEFRIVITDGDGGEVELATGADVATVGDVRQSRQGDYHVPMTLTDEGTAKFRSGLESVGALENRDDHEIRTYFDGNLVHSAHLGPSLAAAIREGDWNGEFVLATADRETARRVRVALEGR